jgi:enoyl-[acyl-carrier protein] reductase I
LCSGYGNIAISLNGKKGLIVERTRSRAPEHQLVSVEDVGNVAAFLVSDAAAALTGNIEYIDAGYRILG